METKIREEVAEEMAQQLVEVDQSMLRQTNEIASIT